MARVLITRLSSFGDVSMLVPVVFSVAARYPQDRFVVLTRKAFAPLFENLGFNISAVTFDANKQHKGFFGSLRLLQSVNRYSYSHVADVHDVLRTKMIRFFMSLMGKKTAYIDKGRAEKKRMIQTKNTQLALTPMWERYLEVFDVLGFPAEMVFKNFFEFKERSLYPLRTIVTEKRGSWVGIAPFSKHKGKIYPLPKMKQVVEKLAADPSITVFLFCSGQQERSIMEKWTGNRSNVISVSGKINMINELLLISYLEAMIAMDSANMHLASLVEVPVVSIWGATHPSFGFYGYKQDINNAIQVELECRPCCVYGEVPCARVDYACLDRISEPMIVRKVYEILYKKTEAGEPQA